MSGEMADEKIKGYVEIKHGDEHYAMQLAMHFTSETKGEAMSMYFPQCEGYRIWDGHMTDDEIQALMDKLWSVGVRPKFVSGA